MQKSYNLKQIGLSDNAIHTYLTMLQHHPVNGSQLSKRSGIARIDRTFVGRYGGPRASRGQPSGASPRRRGPDKDLRR